MIYKNNIIQLLNDIFGPDRVIEKSNDIIIPCPYCGEINTIKDHYHCYLSKHDIFFHCFYCDESGTIYRLIKDITAKDFLVDKYIDKRKIKNISKRSKVKLSNNNDNKYNNLYIPPLGDFIDKRRYIQGRLGYQIEPEQLHGLVLDIAEFIKRNNLQSKIKNPNLIHYLQQNFIGFLTHNKSKLVLRNIDNTSKFRFYKIQIYNPVLLDYYKIEGGDLNCNNIILGEGIFDIWSERLLDSLHLYNNTRMYVCGLSKSYSALLKSVCFDEQLFKVNVTIISDSNVSKYYYRKFFRDVGYLMDKKQIYYNCKGIDFNTYPVLPVKLNSFSITI